MRACNSNVRKFNVKTKGPADAELRLKVDTYGFDQGFFTPKVRPVLWVSAQLVTPSGVVVWEFRDAITRKSEDTAEIRWKRCANPEVGADALRVAARLLATKLVQKVEEAGGQTHCPEQRNQDADCSGDVSKGAGVVHRER